MVIMALDHVRDFFHQDAMLHDPLDLATTTPWLFFTRWITHFCAPVFVFLAGISAYLSGLRKSRGAFSAFLVTRGLWLVLIEFAVIGLGWTFDIFYHVLVFQVIWAIGISMILLGLLAWLPYRLLLALGLIILCGHNLLDPLEAARNGQVGFWWDLLHHGGFATYPYAEGHAVLIIYPFLPWTGLMLTGYCAGRLFEPRVSAASRKKTLLMAGSGLLVLFMLLRSTGLYGDPSPWIPQQDFIRSLLSFVNVSKYPPSLQYVCLTIGPGLILLAFTEQVKNGFTKAVSVFGRVPFFYYILHVYLIHVLVVITFFLSGFSTADIVSGQSPFLFRPPQMGFSLGIVYLLWLFVLLLLYPLCRWYDRYKQKHRSWWTSYV
jgi:uncharacterized membrane protein